MVSRLLSMPRQHLDMVIHLVHPDEVLVLSASWVQASEWQSGGATHRRYPLYPCSERMRMRRCTAVFLEAGKSRLCLRLIVRLAQAPDDPHTDESKAAHHTLNQQQDRDAMTKHLWDSTCHKINQGMEQDGQ